MNVGDASLWGGIGAVATTVGVGWTVMHGRRADRRERAIHEEEQRKSLAAIAAQNAEQLRKQTQFEADWNGEPDRPGVPGRDGVMKRLQTQDEKLDRVEANTRSLPDRMVQLEEAQRTDRTLLHELRTRFDDHFVMQHHVAPTAIVVPVPGQQAGTSS